MTEPIRKILVVEDEPIVRGLLAAALHSAGFGAFTAADADEALAVFGEVDPDAMLIDIELGDGPTGLDLADGLLPQHPGLGVVFLTRLPDARFVNGTTPKLQPNIAWVRKQDVADPEQLSAILDQVLRGAAGPELRSDRDPSRPLAQLTNAQLEIIQLVAAGLGNEEIAELRGTSVRAVQSLLQRTFAVCGIDAHGGNSRVLAVRLLATEAALPS